MPGTGETVVTQARQYLTSWNLQSSPVKGSHQSMSNHNCDREESFLTTGALRA